MRKLAFTAIAFLGGAMLSAPAQALPIGVQTFDSPHGWVTGVGPVIGSPTPVPVSPGGGPDGAADPFLLLEATGGDGPGSRLSAQNFGEWAGDYLAAGIDSILMDVNNFGPDDLFLRLLFVEFGAMGPVNAAFTDAVFVASGSGWEDIYFPIAPSNLTVLLGTAEDALANADELRIFHNEDPVFAVGLNPPVTATLGVDNIAAATGAIPEPAVTTLLLAGLLTAAARRRLHGRA
jgi:hypothetical protein